MMDTEAFREFKQGLTLLRDNYAIKALPHMKRNQAQLYLNLAEVYATAGRRDEAVEALQAGLKFARRDIRLNIAMNKLTRRRQPVLSFLKRHHPINRSLGKIRHETLTLIGKA